MLCIYENQIINHQENSLFQLRHQRYTFSKIFYYYYFIGTTNTLKPEKVNINIV